MAALFRLVMSRCEEGAAPSNADGGPGNHPSLVAIFNSSDGDGLADLADQKHLDALQSQESSENSLAQRNAELARIREALQQLRDYFFTLHPDNFALIGTYGFTVLQGRARGDDKPRVVMPENYEKLTALASRIATVLAERFSDDAAAEGYDAFVASFVHNGSALGGEAISVVIESARSLHDAYRSASEASQIGFAARNELAARMRKTLRRVRDYGFAVTAPNYERVGELRFDVIQSGPSNTEDNDEPGGEPGGDDGDSSGGGDSQEPPPEPPEEPGNEPDEPGNDPGEPGNEPDEPLGEL